MFTHKIPRMAGIADVKGGLGTHQTPLSFLFTRAAKEVTSWKGVGRTSRVARANAMVKVKPMPRPYDRTRSFPKM